MQLDYTIDHTHINDVIADSYSTSSIQISSLSFMNDANWISNSQEHLEAILQIADEFYDLIRTAINKYKSRLLTNTTQKSNPIPIKFDSNTIDISPSFGSIRFLGIFININLRCSLIKYD